MEKKEDFRSVEGKDDFRGGKVGSPKLSRSPLLGLGRGRARGKVPREEDEMKVGFLPTELPVERFRNMSLEGFGGEEEAIEEASSGMRGTQRGAVAKYVFKTEQDMKPSGMKGKEGSVGRPFSLIANYFLLLQRPTWALYQHRVDFEPQVDNERVRKGLLRGVAKDVGAYIFDGTLLYSSRELSNGSEPFVVIAERNKDTAEGKAGDKVAIRIRRTMKLESRDDLMYKSFFNLVVRKCLYAMDMELMGRNFFDRNAAIKVPQHRLELWPGFDTSIRKHDGGFMLCAELTHKVLRLDSVLTVIQGLKNSRDFRRAVEEELCDAVVMTSYNRKTYKISDIAWDLSPQSTFDWKGTQETYFHYYETKHQVKVTDMQQPLLVIRPSARELRDPKFPKDPNSVIYLIPELCQMTGLSEAMRSNFGLMKDLGKHLHTGPAERVQALTTFINRLLLNAVELKSWDLDFDSKLAKCEGRILPGEGIIFAGPKPPEVPNDKADWTMAFRSRQMLSAVNLDKWVIIVPQRDAPNIEHLVKTMTNVARPLNMTIKPPLEVLKITDIKPVAYALAAESLIKKHSGNLQLLFVVLPNNAADRYAAVKKRLSIDYGILSQCFLSKNVTSKGLMSIATKVVIQMNAKLGGEPWTVQIPLKKTMIVGFDVHRALKSGSAVGALVASISQSFATYFSTVSFHNSQEELSKNLAVDLGKAIHAYETRNGEFPERIIFYRDGVGDGQLKQVFEQELVQLQAAIKSICVEKGVPEMKLTFVVVSKKINTRLFSAGGKPDNPPPGTVLDNVITLPERFDFFLISSTARQGTVSPCSYTVLHDSAELGADKIQRITFKMCHLYFNWSGTVAVPATCQYAHKLAYLTGLALGGAPSANLQHLLHYL